MDLEQVITILIYTHAVCGGIALISGGIALLTKKGSEPHKKFGLAFFYAMLASALMSFVISILPGHENAFLFSIGVFSTYFLLSGYRSLNYKSGDFSLTVDKIIAITVAVTGFIMILYPIILFNTSNLILLIFGVMGVYSGVRDLISFKDKTNLKNNWLKRHLGKMTGGYIAAVSAFFVVNDVLPGVWNWFTPGIIGGAYITYWMMKVNKKNKA